MVERHFRADPSARSLLLVVGCKTHDPAERLSLALAATANPPEILDDSRVWAVRLAPHTQPVEFCAAVASGSAPINAVLGPTWDEIDRPAPACWPQVLTTHGILARASKAYVVDEIPLPLDNPWRRNVRVGDLQFFRNGSAAAVTMDGDVWLIDGLGGDLAAVHWRRFASGLHEPLGLAIRDDQIYVFDRNGIWRLRDTHGTGEADDYELFCNAFTQTASTREYPNTIKLAPDRSFIIAKGGTSSTGTVGRDSGTVLRVAPDGKSFTVLGWGFRQPFAGVNPVSGLVTATDQQGFYVPATPLYALTKNEYHGYLDEFQPPEKYPAPIADPLTWVPHPVDQSAVSQVWLIGARMGPLNGALVMVSYTRPEIIPRYC